MDIDFPAAHSMDTLWFAIDQDGYVAIFFTAEDGFMRSEAADVEGSELVDIYRTLAGEDPPGLDEEGDIDDWEEVLGALGDIGFFHYNYIVGGEPAGLNEEGELLLPYTLWVVPETPLHVDQLPPDVRQKCRRCRLEGVRFNEEDEYVQPLESCAPNAFWAHSRDACAYLNAEHSAVKPLPGKEKQYQEWVRKVGAELKQWKGVQVEGLEE